MRVAWSDEKLILLYCPGRGSNSRPPAHRSFKHGQSVGCPSVPVLESSVMSGPEKIRSRGSWSHIVSKATDA